MPVRWQLRQQLRGLHVPWRRRSFRGLRSGRSWSVRCAERTSKTGYSATARKHQERYVTLGCNVMTVVCECRTKQQAIAAASERNKEQARRQAEVDAERAACARRRIRVGEEWGGM